MCPHSHLLPRALHRRRTPVSCMYRCYACLTSQHHHQHPTPPNPTPHVTCSSYPWWPPSRAHMPHAVPLPHHRRRHGHQQTPPLAHQPRPPRQPCHHPPPSPRAPGSWMTCWTSWWAHPPTRDHSQRRPPATRSAPHRLPRHLAPGHRRSLPPPLEAVGGPPAAPQTPPPSLPTLVTSNAPAPRSWQWPKPRWTSCLRRTSSSRATRATSSTSASSLRPPPSPAPGMTDTVLSTGVETAICLCIR